MKCCVAQSEVKGETWESNQECRLCYLWTIDRVNCSNSERANVDVVGQFVEVGRSTVTSK
jgi:hypothetical protein